MIKELIVNGEIGLFNSELIPLGFAGENNGLRPQHIFGGTLLKNDPLNVSRAKGLKVQGMEEGGGNSGFAVKDDELLNLGQMALDVKLRGHETSEILFGFWTEREKRLLRLGGLGFFALG